MKIARHLLAQAIAKRTLHVSDGKALAREIAAYLLAERRTAELGSIVRDIMQYRLEHGGVLEANVVSAHELDAEVLHDVRRLLKTAYPSVKEITLNPKRDDTVIGGVKLELPNEQLDLTVRAKLSKFKTLTGAGGNI